MYTLWLQNCSTYKIKCLTLTIPYLINVSLTNISCTRQPSFKVTLYWEKTDTLFWSSFLLPTMIQSLNRKKCRLQHFFNHRLLSGCTEQWIRGNKRRQVMSPPNREKLCSAKISRDNVATCKITQCVQTMMLSESHLLLSTPMLISPERLSVRVSSSLYSTARI